MKQLSRNLVSHNRLRVFRMFCSMHGLRTPGEEIAFTARKKINSRTEIFRYGRSIFCLPHQHKFSDFFDFCLHWVSVVRRGLNLFINFSASVVKTLFCESCENLNFLFCHAVFTFLRTVLLSF